MEETDTKIKAMQDLQRQVVQSEVDYRYVLEKRIEKAREILERARQHWYSITLVEEALKVLEGK